MTGRIPPNSRSKRIPNDALLLDLLARVVPDDAALTRVLVENPALLYRFS